MDVVVLELASQGLEPAHRSRRQLAPGQRYVIGRDTDASISIPWDPQLSRRHVQVDVHLDHLQLTRLDSARNPLFFAGESVATCRVEIGQHFVIGSTTFHLAPMEAEPGIVAVPFEEVAFKPQELRKIRYQDPENRIEVLTHLPEVISGARNDDELYHRLANLLLKGVVHAEAVAIVTTAGTDDVQMLHWDRRHETAGPFRPSRRLVTEALERRRSSVLHIWEKDSPQSHDKTLMQEFDWAYCTPVPGLALESAGLYVAGRMGKTFIPGTTLSDALQLEADVKFTELVAEIIGAVVRAKRLERQKAGLRQFFAPPILAALGDELDTTLLEPSECDVTVMFCDLRGFSQRAETEVGDLIGLLERVSRALGVMTQHILENGGVTGDFQGDATLGFWGWPFPSPDAAVHACRAALGIRAAFAKAAATRNHPLADFTMGIGIAHGRAVAGKIGTAEQVKVTVFGPVVNLASRLESMTKQLRVPIVLDEATARIVRPRLASSEGRLRRLAKLLPYGMENPVIVSELLPPLSDDPDLSDAQIESYERGVEHFIEGQWDEAYRCLHAMPPSDRAQDFLMQQIVSHNRTAPENWDGIVRLPSK
ncbi:adenylate/guanylate cyclase domain-containing protein [Schlesneria paludicola]|uniref:adenylate/guanylate cyclase domain-containing protein n=1 Tax=Schlesneria paludicola TaxID=360056 RepID=UPI001ED92128|nr:adenylate/guanylate cyclase domain-containing protein [Schlesneria paludicola]